MTDTLEVNVDELGPVDYLIIEFPADAQNFTGEMAAELVGSSDAGTIRSSTSCSSRRTTTAR